MKDYEKIFEEKCKNFLEYIINHFSEMNLTPFGLCENASEAVDKLFGMDFVFDIDGTKFYFNNFKDAQKFAGTMKYDTKHILYGLKDRNIVVEGTCEL